MRAERDVVLAGEDRQVVGQRVGVAGHRVGTRGVLRAQVEGDLVADVHRGALVGRLAVVADQDRRGAQLVGDHVGEARVELGDQRVGPVGLQVGRVVEVVRGAAGAVFIGVGVRELVAQHQLVGFVDVPVEAREEVDGAVLDLVLGVGLGEVGVGAVRALVFLEHRVGHRRVEDVAVVDVVPDHVLAQGPVLVAPERRGIGVGIGLGEVFGAREEEELVLDDRGAEGETVGLVQLVLILLALRQVPVVLHLLRRAGGGADQVLVEEVGVEGTLDLVGTGLRDGVDGAAGEAGLAHVEGRDHDLYLLDGVQRNRVGARLAAVGAGSRETEGVVGHCAVDLEGVVAVVRAGEGDAAILVDRGLGRELHDVIDAAADRRHGFHLLQVEARARARDAGVERLLTHDGNGVQFVHGLHHRVDFVGFAELQRDVAVLDRRHSEEGDLHLVGAADVHAVDVETAVAVGHGVVLGARGLVDRDDGRTGERFVALIHDAADHAGGRHLRKGGDAEQGRRQDGEDPFEGYGLLHIGYD